MGQKVHPLGFRLGYTQKHKNYWYTNKKNYVIWLQDANFIRTYLEKKFIKAGLSDIEIRRSFITESSILIKLYVARPKIFFNNIFLPKQLHSNFSKNRNLILKLKKLRDDLVKDLKKFYKLRNLVDPVNLICHLTVQEMKNPDKSAEVLAQILVNDLERRVTFQKALQKITEKAKKAGIQGIKIKISGRLNGVEMARSINYQSGPVPLHTLRAKIDYSEKKARTIYGIFGVKIWIFHGESLIKLSNN
uniref:ribosomal protein S3 n=1 Tax=Prototheca fontanea TaxID=2836215 RepID=UPI003001B3B4